MGKLAGFRYREIVMRLRRLGFEFDRQAAGSHEIWYNYTTNRYTTIPMKNIGTRRAAEKPRPPRKPISANQGKAGTARHVGGVG